MSRIFETYNVKVNPGSTAPRTLCQFEVQANQRIVLSAIEFEPIGSAGATPPIEFDLATQTDGGVASQDDGSIIVNSPGADESPRLKVRKTFTEEPAGPVQQLPIALHRQAVRPWKPPNPFGEIIMKGGSRWGLRVLTACDFAISVSIQLEE